MTAAAAVDDDGVALARVVAAAVLVALKGRKMRRTVPAMKFLTTSADT